MTETVQKPLTGRQVFFWLTAFFLVVIAVNALMAYLGEWSWTGLTAEHSYTQGVEYNTVIDEAERQVELGWVVRFDPEVETKQDGALTTATLSAVITGKNGDTLPDLKVTARLVRPTSEGNDQAVTFSTSDGRRYTAQATFPLRGLWDINLTAVNAQGTYRIRHRIQLP
jgi:nitrogen fixation protein FixH